MSDPLDGIENKAGLVGDVARDLLAQAAIAKRSSDVSTPIKTYLNGRVVVYGDRGTKATRTEIELKEGRVKVHNDILHASGIFAAAERFSLVEVVRKSDDRVFTIRIEINLDTSPFNPVYLFYDGDTKLGFGYGQHLDLEIAEGVLREQFYGYTGSHVSYEVIGWIREKLGLE